MGLMLEQGRRGSCVYNLDTYREVYGLDIFSSIQLHHSDSTLLALCYLTLAFFMLPYMSVCMHVCMYAFMHLCTIYVCIYVLCMYVFMYYVCKPVGTMYACMLVF